MFVHKSNDEVFVNC